MFGQGYELFLVRIFRAGSISLDLMKETDVKPVSCRCDCMQAMRVEYE